MLFGKRPPRKTPRPLVLATQSEPFIDRDTQSAVISSAPTLPLVRHFSNATRSHARSSLALVADDHKNSSLTVLGCVCAFGALATVAYQWVMKDPWNPPAAVQSIQKIGDFGLSARNAADGKLSELETQTRTSCANTTKVQFATSPTRIGEERPADQPTVVFTDFGGANPESNAYTLCLVKQNIERLCDGDSVKHTADTLQGYFWSLDPMNGLDQSLAFGIMRAAQSMQPNSQFNSVSAKIGLGSETDGFPKSKADPQIVAQVRTLLEQGYLRKSDLFLDITGTPTGAKGLFDDVKQGKAPSCGKSA